MAEREIPPPMSVSALTGELKRTIEPKFARIYVEGEISGWKQYPSGHAYFTLKDDSANISAVMFASSLARCKARQGLKDGAKVIVYGNVTVYEPRGNYQLVVLAAKLAGVGDLMQKYLELKEKLKGEGLFDQSRKRKLPAMPRRIGIVTSEAGAVIHDMCNVLTRRFPNLAIRLFPSLVQGAEAPRSLIAGVNYFNSGEWAADLIIIARGGGSFEDLFCFNDEGLIRAIAASKVPTISAVGHETDYTLCDFVADVRAGTPSIAAEMAVPEFAKIRQRLQDAGLRMTSALRGKGEWYAQRIDQFHAALSASLRLSLARVERRFAELRPRLAGSLQVALGKAERRMAELRPRSEAALNLALQRADSRLGKAVAKLEAYSPYSVLERGYSLTTAADGTVIKSVRQLAEGDKTTTRFADGTASSVVVRAGG